MLEVRNPKLTKRRYQIKRKTPTQLDLSLFTFSKPVSGVSKRGDSPSFYFFPFEGERDTGDRVDKPS